MLKSTSDSLLVLGNLHFLTFRVLCEMDFSIFHWIDGQYIAFPIQSIHNAAALVYTLLRQQIKFSQGFTFDKIPWGQGGANRRKLPKTAENHQKLHENERNLENC